MDRCPFCKSKKIVPVDGETMFCESCKKAFLLGTEEEEVKKK